MLCVNNYSQKYIDACRSRVNSQVSAYNKLATTARNKIGINETSLIAAIKSFEHIFYNNMVLILDSFWSQSQGCRKKDGNPLNEVRVICNSMVHNNNILCADNTIKLNPDKSVLKYKVGDEIKLNEAGFLLLSKAFLDEIESKYL